jgi:cardiolipin synthase
MSLTAARSFYDRLLAAGVEVYERQHVVLHAKTACVDGQTSIIGSTNLDYRSIEYNLELSAIIRSKKFGEQMHTLFENDVSYAIRVDPKVWRRRAIRDRIGQWAVSRARYLL